MKEPLEIAHERITQLEGENTRLRAALAQSPGACVYCSLPAEDWAKCAHGFPGCSRADDAMGCPELGASMRLDFADRELQLMITRFEKSGEKRIAHVVKLLRSLVMGMPRPAE